MQLLAYQRLMNKRNTGIYLWNWYLDRIKNYLLVEEAPNIMKILTVEKMKEFYIQKMGSKHKKKVDLY